jgi:hypothetical protein
MNSEKLVKSTVKLVAKIANLDYDKLKTDTKKIVKMARNYDQEVLGMMEELLDLSTVTSEEELVEFNTPVLKIFCQIKELDTNDLNDRQIRKLVWEYMEEEMMNEEDDSDDDDDDFIDDDELNSDPESEEELEEEPVKQKKVKKVSIVEESETPVVKKKKEKVEKVTLVE